MKMEMHIFGLKLGKQSPISEISIDMNHPQMGGSWSVYHGLPHKK
jgi:hypothetical protein